MIRSKRLPSISALTLEESHYRPHKLTQSPSNRKMPTSGNRIFGGNNEVEVMMGEMFDLNLVDSGSSLSRTGLVNDPGRRVYAHVTGFATIPGAPGRNIQPYTTYEIRVSSSAETSPKWTVYRRYSTFITLVYRLMKLVKELGLPIRVPGLPSKTTTLQSLESSFIRDRAFGLHEWLQVAMGTWKNELAHRQEVNELFAEFLSEDADIFPPGLETVGITKFSPSSESSFVVLEEKKEDNGSSGNPTFKKQKTEENVAIEDQQQRHGQASVTKKMTFVNGMNDFRLLKVIGQGSFGKVLLAQSQHKTNNRNIYAIKALDKADMVMRKQSLRVELERKCLVEMVNCPFIVTLCGTFATESHVYFVQEYCPGGEVYFHLNNGKFSSKLARFYAAEVVIALTHLHRAGIVYRDLKPENLMLDERGHIKIVDFGLAKIGVYDACSGALSFVGTQEYFSPEMLAKKGHGYAVDYWSLGMVLYEMLTSLPPWYTEERQVLFERIQNAPVHFPTGEISTTTRQFLRSLLAKDPRQRLGSKNIDDVRNHPYFKMIDFDLLEQRRIKPPFIPNIKSGIDTSYFDPEFTTLPVTSAPVKYKPEALEKLQKAEADGLFEQF